MSTQLGNENGIKMDTDCITIDDCKIYHKSDDTNMSSTSWTHQYMRDYIKKGSSYLEQMNNKQDKMMVLLNGLVKDVRYLKKTSPPAETKLGLTDWKPSSEKDCEMISTKGEEDELSAMSKILQVLKLTDSVGGDASKFLDSTDKLLIDFGGKLNYDIFGSDVNHYKYLETSDVLTDEDKMKKIKALLDEKCNNRLIISHHLDMPTSPVKRFSPVLLDINTRVSRPTFVENPIHKVVLDNPKTWLTFAN